MIIIRNNIIPFKGYKAMTLWPFIFVRKNCTLTDIDINHERIHGRQQVEMLIIFFRLWYLFEWVIRCISSIFNGQRPYYDISFEREAYANENNLDYLSSRPFWAFLKYL